METKFVDWYAIVPAVCYAVMLALIVIFNFAIGNFSHA